jgi:hypothetical protein
VLQSAVVVAPFLCSGWSLMQSQQSTNSFRSVIHNLDYQVERQCVIVRRVLPDTPPLLLCRHAA